MRYLLFTVLFAAAMAAASPVSAGQIFVAQPETGGGRFDSLISETEQDYWSLKICFTDAYNSGDRSWSKYLEKSGFRIDVVEKKIAARLQTLSNMHRVVNILPEAQRAQANETIGYLEATNMTLLSLIKDNGGYKTCVTDRNDGLRRDINLWHEGIRSAIAETRDRMHLCRNSNETRTFLASFTDK